MKIRNRLWKVLGAAGILVALAGCGTNEPGTAAIDKGTSGSGGQQNGIVAGELTPRLTEAPEGNHQYLFEIRNDKTVVAKLSMNSGQQYDYQIKDSSGTVLYTWSADKSFTQMMQTETLSPGEILGMTIDATEGLQNLPAGTYTLEVWSTAKEEDLRATAEIVWDGASSAPAGEKLKVEEQNVTYVGLQDVNSIEVTNEQNEPEAMRLSETAKPFFDELEKDTKITVFYVLIDGQKVIQSAVLQ